MSIDTGTAITVFYYTGVVIIGMVAVTGLVMIAFYLVRLMRALIHYASRQWWRW